MLHLGPLRLDPVSLRLRAAAGPVKLRPKAAALLIVLASRPGQTFRKDELLEALWPDKFVEEKNLAVLVGEIRRALAPFLSEASAIATIPGEGYRLAIPVASGARGAPPSDDAGIDWLSAQASKPRVQLLPLRAAQPAAEFIALTDSINASLTTRLASVASVTLGGQPHAEASADLLVTGAVFAEGTRIRFHLHVLDAVGRAVLWADQVTATRENFFDAEDRLCERMVGRVAEIWLHSRWPAASHGSYAPEILHAYQLGCHFLSRRTARSLDRARALFVTALEMNARFAPALVGLAQCWAVEAYYTDADPRACAERAVKFSASALEIDATLSQAFAASGFAHLNLLEWDKAETDLRQALALDPRNVEARHYYSEYLTCGGRHAEAISTMRAALQLEPASRILNSDFGKMLMLAGRFDEAAEQLRATVELDPDFPLAHYRLGLTLACQGKFSEARDTCERAAELSSEVSLYVALRACCEALSGRRREATEILHRLKQRGITQPGVWYGLALLHLELGEKDTALEAVRYAVAQRAPLTIYAQVDPLLDGLRKMRGFQEVSRDLTVHA